MYTDYSCELNDSTSESDEVYTLELPLPHIHYFINSLVQFKCLWKRAAQSQLKFLWGGWDPVPILVEGRGLLVGGHGCLGVEKRVGVSFIRAEAATEAIVVSMGFKFHVIHV